MRDFSQPRTFILSAYRASATREANIRAHDELASDLALAGVPFKDCEGCYAGEYEQGYVITGAESQGAVIDLALANEQETYLLIAENDRTAYLVDPATNYHSHLGRFHSVGDALPAGDGWTLFNGTYFTTDNAPGVDLPRGL